MNKVFIKPLKSGVIDPQTKKEIPANGQEVFLNVFWLRMEKRKEIKILTKLENQAAAPAADVQEV